MNYNNSNDIRSTITIYIISQKRMEEEKEEEIKKKRRGGGGDNFFHFDSHIGLGGGAMEHN